MRVVPVLDVLDGRVVRARGGARQGYRPEPSRLADGHDPVPWAVAMAAAAGHPALYVADLDAVAGRRPPDAALLAALRDAGAEVWLDAGVRNAADVAALRQAGAARVVVGTETLRHADELPAIAADIILSIDLMAGGLLAPAYAWPDRNPAAVAASAVGLGARTALLLDLADVGAAAGPRTLP